MISLKNFELVNSTDEENKILDRLDNYYQEFNEMTGQERYFLNSMILRNKPVKILELGVSAGSSSMILLNAIKENDKGELYSIDYSNHWYKDQSCKTGFVLDKYPELKEKWKLYTGTLALAFLEQIGDGIDFVFIDTMHTNPGEILDFLMVLPFLKEEALVVFHDTKLYTDINSADKHGQRYMAFANTNNLLMSAVYGKKYIPMGEAEINLPFKKVNKNIPKVAGSEIHFPNIGAIAIDKETRNRIFEVFNLLTLQWLYMPSDDELVEIINFFSKYYDPLLVNHFKEIIFLQKIYQPWFIKNIIYNNGRTEISIEHKADIKHKITIKKLIKYLLPYGLVRLIQRRFKK
jgi:predicted O-methyltransferase YrrM